MPHTIILFWLTFFAFAQILQDSMLIIYSQLHKKVNISQSSIVPQ